MPDCRTCHGRYNWIAWAPRSAEWWGGLLYTLGIVAFLISLSSEEINDCEGHAESDRVHVGAQMPLFHLVGCLPFTS